VLFRWQAGTVLGNLLGDRLAVKPFLQVLKKKAYMGLEVKEMVRKLRKSITNYRHRKVIINGCHAPFDVTLSH